MTSPPFVGAANEGKKVEMNLAALVASLMWLHSCTRIECKVLQSSTSPVALHHSDPSIIFENSGRDEGGMQWGLTFPGNWRGGAVQRPGATAGVGRIAALGLR